MDVGISGEGIKNFNLVGWGKISSLYIQDILEPYPHHPDIDAVLSEVKAMAVGTEDVGGMQAPFDPIDWRWLGSTNRTSAFGH